MTVGDSKRPVDENELSETLIEELRPGSVSLSDLYLKVAGRHILIHRAGGLITNTFIKKYQALKVKSFFSLVVGEEKDKDVFIELFQELELHKDLTSLLEVRDKILKVFADWYWRHSQKSLLAFSAAAFETFYNLPIEVVDKTYEVSTDLYCKNLLSSALTIISALSVSLVDRSFIKDLYNTAYLLDISLVLSPQFNSYLLVACEKERVLVNGGRKYLKQFYRSAEELELFHDHPLLSYEYGKQFINNFTYSEVLSFIKLHHELEYGEGFPSSLTGSGVSETERILSFVDRLVPFHEASLLLFSPGLRVHRLYRDLMSNESLDEFGIDNLSIKWLSSMESTTTVDRYVKEKQESEIA